MPSLSITNQGAVEALLRQFAALPRFKKWVYPRETRQAIQELIRGRAAWPLRRWSTDEVLPLVQAVHHGWSFLKQRMPALVTFESSSFMLSYQKVLTLPDGVLLGNEYDAIAGSNSPENAINALTHLRTLGLYTHDNFRAALNHESLDGVVRALKILTEIKPVPNLRQKQWYCDTVLASVLPAQVALVFKNDTDYLWGNGLLGANLKKIHSVLAHSKNPAAVAEGIHHLYVTTNGGLLTNPILDICLGVLERHSKPADAARIIAFLYAHNLLKLPSDALRNCARVEAHPNPAALYHGLRASSAGPELWFVDHRRIQAHFDELVEHEHPFDHGFVLASHRLGEEPPRMLPRGPS